MSEVVKDDVVTVEIEDGEEYGESPLRERRTYFLFFIHTHTLKAFMIHTYNHIHNLSLHINY